MKKSYIILLLVLLVGVLLTGLLLSDPAGRWFDETGEEGPALVTTVEGDVSLLRDGSSYHLKPDVRLREDDVLITGEGASCEVLADAGAVIVLDEASSVELEALTETDATVEVLEGAALFEAPHGTDTSLTVTADGTALRRTNGGIFAVEACQGTVTLSILKGMPLLECAEREVVLIPGDSVIVPKNEQHETEGVTLSGIAPTTLREFLLRQLIARGGMLFDPADLRAVLDARRRETEQLALPPDGEGPTCTLEIVCDTVLDKPPPENGWTPPDGGVVLAATRIAFTEGDSVFSILRRWCLSNDVALDYDYTVAFGGYYIRMLAGLREFDMGPASGWMYKVNGWFPNYGASHCALHDGDVVVWCYTCAMGEDVGLENPPTHTLEEIAASGER